MLDLARLNIRQNGMEDRLQVCQGDIPAAQGGGLVPRSFDHVMTNPPFFEQGTWFASQAKAHAHHHTLTTLGGWLDFCVRMLCFRGTLTVVHRADHLDRLCHALNTLGVGDLAITPLWPRPGHPAHRILVQGRAGSKGSCRLHPGVCLQDETGAPSPAAEQIARQGMPLLQGQASTKGSAPDI
jgi:tRNA1(Val) A37 N6-methylase TrmN6